MGSPEYMAPERTRGQAGGPASDLWSLGMTLYVCVEGDNPARRDSVWQALVAVCDQPLPVPAHGEPLAPVIEALLVKEAGFRPDAATLERRLTAVEAGEAVTEALRRLDVPTLVERAVPVRSVASRPQDPTQRSAITFILGTPRRMGIARAPTAVKIASNASVK
ncbi:hypothetical protein ACGF12_36955 [Kitasatospora sp. NPDC048296]|uniref:protein kinase domain-containing protein n=1 Tax=Kitasatospora sp. NPDC048296 TaxID=3364048 RepID=UPI0037196499